MIEDTAFPHQSISLIMGTANMSSPSQKTASSTSIRTNTDATLSRRAGSYAAIACRTYYSLNSFPRTKLGAQSFAYPALHCSLGHTIHLHLLIALGRQRMRMSPFKILANSTYRGVSRCTIAACTADSLVSANSIKLKVAPNEYPGPIERDGDDDAVQVGLPGLALCQEALDALPRPLQPPQCARTADGVGEEGLVRQRQVGQEDACLLMLQDDACQLCIASKCELHRRMYTQCGAGHHA